MKNGPSSAVAEGSGPARKGNGILGASARPMCRLERSRLGVGIVIIVNVRRRDSEMCSASDIQRELACHEQNAPHGLAHG